MATDANPETVLRLEGITKRFGALVANDNISINSNRGEIVALLGENGAGKTTLMNILFGHYTADDGSIEVFGKALPPGEPRAAIAAGIGMVHQHFTLAENSQRARQYHARHRASVAPVVGSCRRSTAHRDAREKLRARVWHLMQRSAIYLWASASASKSSKPSIAMRAS